MPAALMSSDLCVFTPAPSFGPGDPESVSDGRKGGSGMPAETGEGAGGEERNQEGGAEGGNSEPKA